MALVSLVKASSVHSSRGHRLSVMKRQQSHATSNVKAACRACRASKTKVRTISHSTPLHRTYRTVTSHDEAYDILKRMRAGDDDLSIFVGLLEKRSNYTNRDVVQSTATHKDGAAVFADSSDDRNSIAFLLARNSPTRAESE
ncbi:unnamed protein product [Zymoseptoria tritici ST99CH_1E4]|uniref:Uncharacterized protein n=2 Tax=Zymoseptoria tritici TaxID=1047171 RepID=F9XKI7_ZYMTI|nr:uncharacterized protein MYCGRDRAFT_95995 [Zymoseptoria tritici IPO323]EGP84232.1 hypothetical protein MYCGRDRAFT_95995 [Zymoseptoria tritici IPO323]SMR58840.1 unnamed protein product [Zymoseptoria tritici ST99CH_1E4]